MQLEEYQDRFRNIALSRDDSGILRMRVHTDGGTLQWGADEGAIHGQLGDAFYAIARDRDTRVVIMEGTGDDYCFSRNMAEFTSLETDEASYRLIREGRDILTNQMEIEVPVISLVRGRALIHPEIPLMADIVLATPDATFRDSHVASNLVPGDGAQIFWTSVLGPTRASYFFLTEQMLTAEDGHRLGFVHEVVPAETLEARALEIAKDLVSKSPFALRYTRMVVHHEWRKRFATESSFGFVTEMLSMKSKGGQHNFDPNRLLGKK